ncbi:MAG TPA: DinB family protein [Thermoanaerobaculia bacterium]|jgi:uncharacterized damage-inducible protein DinB|nr:DinB family protein [Thermoanaerobaculia bacterium]
MKDDLLSLYAYNKWANARVLDSLRSLSADDYTRELGGGWPSLRATLVHLAGATDAWAERFGGRDVTVLPTPEQVPTLENAATLLRGAETKLDAFLSTLAPEKPAGAFTWKNLKGEPKTAPFWAVLRHVVNHGTYHRGQISSMVKRVGGKPIATDMVVWGIEIQKTT